MLKGSSRQVLSFMAGAFLPLLQLSAVPVAIMLAASLLSLSVLGGVMQDIGQITLNTAPDPELMARLTRADAFVMPLTVVSMLAMVWLFVRVVRLYALGELSWTSFGNGGVKPLLMTAVYALGVGALTLIAYFVLIIALALIAVPFGILSGGSGEGFAAGFVMIAGIPVMVLGLTWFFCRFAVGLPGVALGATPDFFKDMWALAKNNSWGLPLRLIAVQIIAAAVFVPIYGAVIWSSLTPDLLAKLESGNENASVFLMAAVFDKLVPLSIFNTLMQVPLVWFVSLLLAEAFRRFSGK